MALAEPLPDDVLVVLASRAFALIAAVRLERSLAGAGDAVGHHVIRAPLTLCLKARDSKVSSRIALCTGSRYISRTSSIILSSRALAIAIFVSNKSIRTSAIGIILNCNFVQTTFVTACRLSRCSRKIRILVALCTGAELITSSWSSVILTIRTFAISSISRHR